MNRLLLACCVLFLTQWDALRGSDLVKALNDFASVCSKLEHDLEETVEQPEIVRSVLERYQTAAKTFNTSLRGWEKRTGKSLWGERVRIPKAIGVVRFVPAPLELSVAGASEARYYSASIRIQVEVSSRGVVNCFTIDMPISATKDLRWRLPTVAQIVAKLEAYYTKKAETLLIEAEAFANGIRESLDE